MGAPTSDDLLAVDLVVLDGYLGFRGGVSCRGEKLRRGREGDRWSGLGESGVGRGGEVLVYVLREGELEKGRGGRRLSVG